MDIGEKRDRPISFFPDETVTDGEYHEYSEDGAILSTGNAEGQKASFTYGTNGRLSGILDAAGNQVVWFDYNTQNQLERCRLSDNRQVEYFYTGNLLTKVVDVTGEETRYEYDDNNRLTRVVDANNNEKRITYTDQNEVIAVSDQNGIRLSFYAMAWSKVPFQAASRSHHRCPTDDAFDFKLFDILIGEA